MSKMVYNIDNISTEDECYDGFDWKKKRNRNNDGGNYGIDIATGRFELGR